jgi:hypothetical protein
VGIRNCAGLPGYQGRFFTGTIMVLKRNQIPGFYIYIYISMVLHKFDKVQITTLKMAHSIMNYGSDFLIYNF